MIKLEKVNKYYNKGKKNQIHVIGNTSLELGEKGLVALLGPSGCGKRTVLNVILSAVVSATLFSVMKSMIMILPLTPGLNR